MASFQTFFRTVIMLATLGIVAKVWYLYGPTLDELQTISTRAAELAQQAWTEYWDKPASNALANDPRLPSTSEVPAPFVPSGATIEPIPQASISASNPSGPGSVQLAGGVPAEIVSAAPSSVWPTGAPPQPIRLPSEASSAPTEDARLPALFERLAQWGVRDQQLAAWGSRGELMRFSCSVPWANSPAYSRHFEAVATTPLAAVEQVAAEIEAWRGGQR